MLDRSNIQWSAKTLGNQIDKGKVLFDCAVQRNPCWDLSRKSLLIHSMIEGYPIPPFYFSRGNDKRYDALDGLQRSTAINEFLHEEYSLSEDTPQITDEDGNPVSISGKKMSELPEWAQNNIKDYSLTIYYFEGITDDEISELFFRINNGKPLSSIELTRVKARCLDKFQQIASHKLISDSITDAGKKRYTDENVAMQIWMMCFSDVKDFSTKVFRPCIESANVTSEEVEEVIKAMDLVQFVCDSLDISKKSDKRVIRKIRTRSHLVSVVYLAMQALRVGIMKGTFKNKIFSFFDCAATSINADYNNSVGSGSAKPEKIAARIRVLESLIVKEDKLNGANREQDGN